MARIIKKLKCFLSLHDWAMWQESNLNNYVSQKDKQQYRICLMCYKKQIRPHPPLEDRILAVLETRDTVRIHDKFRKLRREYGVLAFNKAILSIAQSHFYIAVRWSKDEITQRLVKYYIHESTLDNSIAYATMGE